MVRLITASLFVVSLCFVGAARAIPRAATLALAAILLAGAGNVSADILETPYWEAVLADNPVAYWRFEETDGTTAFDSSGNGLHGTYVGGVTLGIPGVLDDEPNQSIVLDGSTGYINVPPNSRLNRLRNNFTIEGWVKNGGMRVSTRDNTSTGGYQYGQGRYGGGFTTFTIKDYSKPFSPPFPEDEWLHCAIVFDSDNNARFFANGEYMGADWGSRPANVNSQPLNIGRHPIADHGGSHNYLSGNIDEIAIYNRALTADEIQEHFLIGFPFPDIRVLDRRVFYNNAALGENAVASDKVALMPGETATFDNYTSYARGINGVMVDVQDFVDLSGLTTEQIGDYLQFRIGNDDDPDAWGDAPPILDVAVAPGEGVDDSDRVTITWEDYAIQNEWLQVTVLANELTGLADDDVFYFGNAVAEAGNSGEDTLVTVTDLLLARENPHNILTNPAGIDYPYDYNRDGHVNAADVLLARNNTTDFLTDLNLITVPGPAGAGQASVVPEPSTLILLGMGLVALAFCAYRRKRRSSRWAAAPIVSAMLLTGAGNAMAEDLETPYWEAVLADNPTGYWRFEETDGTTAFDSSGNGYHGTYVGGVTLGVPGALDDVSSNSVVLDGITGYVDVPASAAFNQLQENFTIEGWVKDGGLFVSTRGPPRGGYAYGASRGGASFTKFNIRDFSEPFDPPFPEGEWLHCAVVVDSEDEMRFYANGEYMGVEWSSRAVFANSQPLNIGRNPVPESNGTMYYRPGNIDELAIYRRALTADEIQEHFLIGFPFPDIRVLDRGVFYNNAALGENPVASDKIALMPGETATFDNYISYDRGINGVTVDVQDFVDLSGLTTEQVGDYLQFRVGNDDDPEAWGDAPPILDVAVASGEGVDDSDRVTITWHDYAIQNEWLQVTTLANELTGLAEDDVFYFGNAVAEAGNSGEDTLVTTTDLLLARENPHNILTNPAGVDYPYDYNRDGHVNTADLLLARNNTTNFLTDLNLITVPGPAGGGAAMSVPEPSTLALLGVGTLGLLGYARRSIQSRRRRLAVEPLENRCLLSVSPSLAPATPAGLEAEQEELLIAVGDHVLQPDAADQQIAIFVDDPTDAAMTAGVSFNAQIGDGGPETADLGLPPGTDGPAITHVELLDGGQLGTTIFGAAANHGHFGEGSLAPQIYVEHTVLETGAVAAEGLLAVITVDTTGFFVGDGSWPLVIGQTLNGATELYDDTPRVAPLPLIVIDGTITIANRPPTANNDAYTTRQAAGFAIAAPGLLANDTDADPGHELRVTAIDTTGITGEVTWDADGSFTYVPTTAPAVDTFTYTIEDGQGGSDSATVTVTVTGLNHAPEAEDDTGATDEDTPLSVEAPGVLGNDADPDEDPLSVVAFEAVSLRGAFVTVDADGSYTYDSSASPEIGTLPAGESTFDTFAYTVGDGQGGSDTATVVITVTGVNDAPVAVDDTVEVYRESALSVAAPGVLANDTDPDTGDAFSVTAFEPLSARGATVTVNGDGSFVYDPQGRFDDLEPGESATDTFAYTIGDGDATDTAVVTVTVTTSPQVRGRKWYDLDRDGEPDEGEPGLAGWTIFADLNANDQLDDGEPSTVTGPDGEYALVLPQDGTYVVAEVPQAGWEQTAPSRPGTAPINPGPVEPGEVKMNYLPATGEFVVSVNGVLNWTLISDGLFTGPGVAALGDVLPLGSPTNFVSANENTIGETQFSGVFSYQDAVLGRLTPPETDVSEFTLQWSVDWGSPVRYGEIEVVGTRFTHTHEVTVGPGEVVDRIDFGNYTNALPSAADDGNSTNKETPIAVAAPGVLANDSDSDGDPLTVIAFDEFSTKGAAVTVEADGSYTYDPTVSAELTALPFGQSATDTFTYTVADGRGGAATGTVTVTIAENELFVDVGNHVLQPDAAEQQIAIFVDDPTDALVTAGVSFNVQIGDGGPETADFGLPPGTEGPAITHVELLDGGLFGDTIFGAAPNHGHFGEGSLAPQIYVEHTALETGAVAADGLLAVITVDTSGFFVGDGPWTVAVGQTLNDATRLYDDTPRVVPLPLSVTDGTIAIANRPPTAEDDIHTTGQATGIAVAAPGLLANDADADPGHVLRVTAVDTTGITGEVTWEADGSFTYVPTTAPAVDTFTYTIEDGQGGSDTATVTVTVTGLNHAPMAEDDTGATDEDTPLSFAAPGVLGNDVDPDEDPLSVTEFDAFSLRGAPVTVDADGGYTYDPSASQELSTLAAGEAADDAFTYTVDDGQGGSNTATVAISLTGVNDAPRAANDAATIDRESLLSVAAPGVLANDLDPDTGDAFSVTAFEPLSAHGAPVTGDADGSISYDPRGLFDDLEPGATATDTFAYTITDGDGATDTATVTVTVTTAPYVRGRKWYDYDRDGEPDAGEPGLAGWTIFADLNANDQLDDGEPSTVTGPDGDYALVLPRPGAYIVGEVPQAGWEQTAPSRLGTGPAKPGPAEPGSVKMNYVPATGEFIVSVNGVLNWAVISDGLFTGPDVLALYEILPLGSPANIVSINPNTVSEAQFAGVFGYEDAALGRLVPPETDVSEFSLQWTVEWGAPVEFGQLKVVGTQLMHTHEVTVGPGDVIDGIDFGNYTNRLPSAADDENSTDKVTPISVAAPGVLANDADPDGDPLTIVAFDELSTKGAAVTVGADGSYSYDPTTSEELAALPAGQSTTDTFTYTIADGADGIATGTVTVTVAEDKLVVEVGHPILLADKPNQQFQIFVGGGQPVQGLELFLQIADGGPEAGGSVDGPTITNVDVFTGTIFADNNTGEAGGGQLVPQFWQSGTTTESGTVDAEGLLATVTIDTTGFSETHPDHPWELKLVDTVMGDSGFPGVPARVTNGTLTLTSLATVVDRHVFYDRSYFDGNQSGAGESDDGAIAVDKEALLPGGQASFANYTSYSRGINGIMIDMFNLPNTPDAADFRFQVGNDDDPSAWADAPAPSGVALRPGAGVDGSDRVTITFEDGAICKQWLRTTVLADRLGLAEDDAFYFGNAIGEGGNSPRDAYVNATDEISARNNPHNFLNRATIDDAYDYNRDSFVTVSDELFARNNSTFFLNALKMLELPSEERAVVSDEIVDALLMHYGS